MCIRSVKNNAITQGQKIKKESQQVQARKKEQNFTKILRGFFSTNWSDFLERFWSIKNIIS